MKFAKMLLKKKYIIIGLIILSILGVILKFTVFADKKPVDTAVVKKGELIKGLTLSGKIEANEHAVLQFQTGGLLSFVGVKKGDYVKPYQTIASLDVRTAEKNLRDKLLDYSIQRLTFDQTKEDNLNRTPEQALNDKMKRVLQDNQYDLDKAVLSVELKQLANELSYLNTPIEGIVTRVDTPFAGVNIYIPSQAQFEVVNPSTIYFSVNADQTEIVSLKEGTEGYVTFDSYLDEKVKSKIELISFTPKKDESETVYEIKAELRDIKNSNYKYKMGMTGDITFVIERKENSIYLPVKFIKSDEKGKYVLMGDKKEKIYIKTGLETDSDIEITQGLTEGNVVYD